jgi:hypothetical protein
MRTLALLAAALAVAPVAGAADAVSMFPPALALRGADDTPQLIVTRTAGGKTTDATAGATYTVADPAVCRVEPDGRVVPLANGRTEIVVAAGSPVKVPVTVAGMESPRPLNFANQIEPILTKAGCNGGGCHGKIAGQNGFRLSLLGFDPDLDYMTLLKEGRGRRLLPAAPDASLFLTKATGKVPHGGGRKLDPDGDEYRVLRRWIASGMPYGRPDDPAVTRVTVFPADRVIDRQGRQQLAVHAHYSDGTVEDVTRRAQYESNAPDVATATEGGLVQTLSTTGQAAVMVRFAGHVTVFRAVVPQPGTVPEYRFHPKTVVDDHTARKWRELNLAPSPGCTDEQFIRRASLDITGTLPTPAEVLAFAADQDPDKRDKLVDRLVDTPEYAYFFATKWADVLRVKRKNQPGRAAGTFAFHGWIRDALAADVPYDRFVREIVTAAGDERANPPTVWYKEVQTPEQFADDLSQVFLGQRLACAQCHHHPYEKWTQDDYYGLAAFFGRVGRKAVPAPGQPTADRDARRQLVFTKSAGSVTNKRTGRPAQIKPLDAPAVSVEPGEDPRARLADWMTAPDNPFLARAVANRYWAHFFGRGLVDPLDDMRVTNPPSNPELLDALAKVLTDSRWSLKALVKVIAKSRTYGLSSTPTEWNQSDRQSFARYYPKRLPAEVVYDAVSQVTDTAGPFPGLPADGNAPRRAIMLPDESFASYFLDVFGRPQRISACECERVNEASLAMTLHLLNSQEVQDKLARPGGRADRLAKDPRPDAEKVTELFLWCVGKRPTEEQLRLALGHLAKAGMNKRQGYENVLWALVNTKAFLFNQ